MKKKYTHVLIDIDNTILDFDECARQGIIEGFKDINMPYTDDIFLEFLKVNKMLWEQFESKIITNAKLHKIRFNTIFSNLGLDIDGLAFEAAFRERLHVSHIPVKGAEEFLQYLYPKYDLSVASNGTLFQQTERVKLAGFTKYFSHLFVSSEVGFQKPDKKFFDKVLSTLNTNKDNIIFVGDSLSADIQGGINSGIDTVWFNPKKIVGEISPTYEIYSLDQIRDIL